MSQPRLKKNASVKKSLNRPLPKNCVQEEIQIHHPTLLNALFQRAIVGFILVGVFVYGITEKELRETAEATGLPKEKTLISALEESETVLKVRPKF